MNEADINWEPELEKTAFRYHIIGLWVAVIFNILFFATDYINIKPYWVQFFFIRCGVSAACLFLILFYKKLKINYQVLIFIPVLLISFQNAYMWSVMDVAALQKHAFAYIALFIGAGMFVFYKVRFSVWVVILSLIANVICFYLNSALSLTDIMGNGGFLTISVAIFSILLIRVRFQLTKKEIIARLALNLSKMELEEKQKEITDSINYAKRIQDAILPPNEWANKLLGDSFILYLPKDIVSGDFYWMHKAGNKILFAAVDCTGHGVPGAMVSVVGHNCLQRAVNEFKLTEPALILDKINELVKESFRQENTELKDGMDISLCSIEPKENGKYEIQFAGANNPLWFVKKDVNGEAELVELKADKHPIGFSFEMKNFTNHSLELEEGDSIYIFSDGYADQFGGEKDKKFKYKELRNNLFLYKKFSMQKQKEALKKDFIEWKGNYEQTDDVLIIGMRLGY